MASPDYWIELALSLLACAPYFILAGIMVLKYLPKSTQTYTRKSGIITLPSMRRFITSMRRPHVPVTKPARYRELLPQLREDVIKLPALIKAPCCGAMINTLGEMESIPDGIKTSVCPQCFKAIDVEELFPATPPEHPEVKFFCKVCGAVTMSDKYVLQRIAATNQPIVMRRCGACNETVYRPVSPTTLPKLRHLEVVA